jgi:YD repeat-containing protein
MIDMLKLPIGCLLLCLVTQASEAQFFYKDLVSTRENTARWLSYRDNRVKSVTLSSFESDGKPTEGFTGEKLFSDDCSEITTHTKTSGSTDSWIITDYSPQGRMVKNTDTSDTYRNVTVYRYDDRGRIQAITDTSIETDNQLKDVEEHLWTYDASHPDKPSSMLKIINGIDTTYVRFVLDEKGNVAEEHATRHGAGLPAIYYYYDAGNHLTDIVRYSPKAQRLLPVNIFEYGEDGRMESMLVVPEEGNSFYQKWYYEYNEKGLKLKDFCFNKEKELLGTVDYQYSYK